MATVAAENKSHGSCQERCGEQRALSLVAGAFISCAALILTSGCTAKSRSPALLAPPFSRFLKCGETFTTTINCRPVDKILFRVTQDNIDVNLTLAGGVGAEYKVDSPSGRFGDEFLVFTCGSQSHHNILIQSQAKSDPGGRIGVATYSLSGATKSMQAAFRHMSDAGRKNAIRGEGAWTDVLSDLSAASESWKNMGMRRE
jgi:hypothetical protein